MMRPRFDASLANRIGKTVAGNAAHVVHGGAQGFQPLGIGSRFVPDTAEIGGAVNKAGCDARRVGVVGGNLLTQRISFATNTWVEAANFLEVVFNVCVVGLGSL